MGTLTASPCRGPATTLQGCKPFVGDKWVFPILSTLFKAGRSNATLLFQHRFPAGQILGVICRHSRHHRRQINAITLWSRFDSHLHQAACQPCKAKDDGLTGATCADTGSLWLAAGAAVVLAKDLECQPLVGGTKHAHSGRGDNCHWACSQEPKASMGCFALVRLHPLSSISSLVHACV